MPAGAVVAPFAVTIHSIALTTPVTITGTYNSVAAQSPELLVTGTSGQAAPLLSSLSLSVPNVIGGSSVSAVVTLTAPAPTGGTVVTLSGSNSAAVTVPATLTVPAGAATATVAFSTIPVTSALTVNVTATLNGESVSAPLGIAPPAIPPAPGTVRINTGGASYTDGSGNIWSADTSYSGGGAWSTSSAISGTSTPTLYQTCRYGTFNYQAAVPDGSYAVTLKFAEISLYGAGQRQFNVAIDGTPVLTNFDIFAQAGWLSAIDQTFPVTVANGQIAIQFTPGAADSPLVSAIQIVPASSSTFTPIRVNASGPQYTDPAGNVWSADTGFLGGNTWITSASDRRNHHAHSVSNLPLGGVLLPVYGAQWKLQRDPEIRRGFGRGSRTAAIQCGD